MEPTLKPKHNKKTKKKKLIFGTPFPRISGIQIMPRQKINERGEKAFLTEIILYKRKGGIKAYIRPYKALQGYRFGYPYILKFGIRCSFKCKTVNRHCA